MKIDDEIECDECGSLLEQLKSEPSPYCANSERLYFYCPKCRYTIKFYTTI